MRAMSWPCNRIAVVVVTLLAVAGLTVGSGSMVRAGTGSCQGSACQQFQPDALIRRSGGLLVGNGVYNLTGDGQSVFRGSNRYRPGACRTIYLYVQNDGNVADTFTYQETEEGTQGAPAFTVTYYTRHPLTDVSSQVDSGTFTTPSLDPAETYGITARVCVNQDAASGSVVRVHVTLTSVGDGTKQDQVGFSLRSR